MAFEFIDKIIDFQAQKKAVAVKTITEADLPYCFNLNNKTYLYPTLLIEAVGQLCAWLAMEYSDFKLRPVAILYHQLDFKAYATLGDVLKVEAELTNIDDQYTRFNGTISVNDQVIFTETDASGSFLPLQIFNSQASVIEEFQDLLQDKRVAKRSNTSACENLFHYTIKDYDAMKQTLTTSYQVLSQCPFFKDHFPNKPIFPVSLLLQLQLKMLTDHCQSKFKMPKPIDLTHFQINKTKIKHFIEPGTDLEFKICLQKKIAAQYFFRVTTQCDNKNICIANYVVTTKL